MNRQDAINLITDTFQNPFDETRFRNFVKNLLNEIDESKAFSAQGQYIPDSYKDHIRQYKRIGKFTDPEGAALDVLLVKLKKETSLERARTMQRNFIAWYLKKRGEKDAALVAYHTDEEEDWRFSFVRMDYRQELTELGKVKIKEELTPARRYSFLVGKNEPNHTARQQLVPILQDVKNNPILAELEKAFNIESVTKEFFGKYKDLFLKVKEELDKLVEKDGKIRNDFSDKKISTAEFAKKLLGQIVFLYFMQKKGWLGVGKDEAGNFRKWGAGPKDFLRRLFEKKIVPYDNFFNDLLEPLFYEALAIDRGEEALYSRFKCKIPFLNGGLFEPIGGYNWQETDILINNDTIAEILHTFDLYNFTVREDEPLEREVAVDPEMLGKVFENLLEIKDRKSKGAYYTPREIVHYMCRESLINYIDTAVNARDQKDIEKDIEKNIELSQDCYIIPQKDIELFIRHGEFAVENDIAKEKGTKSYFYKLPESIRKNAELIDNKLAHIKICDPAIGSGAFPVGILHEIVRARETLTSYMKELPGRTAYDFKRHAIQKSIYGVDIDSSAVDIAKLRLWLSLVVDEEDFESIKPLPNLDYKIVCGNSLLGVQRDLLNAHLYQELESLKQKYFDETNPRQKKKEKEKIDELIKEITNNDEHFDFEVYFSEVCQRMGGFDVVIANPPYVRHEAIKDIKKELKEGFGGFYCGTADIYTYFYKKGLDILKTSGHLCFIAPNKFMRAGYGKNTRNLLAGDATPKTIIDFGDLPIFDATTYPAIILLEKRKPGIKDKTTVASFSGTEQLDNLEGTLKNIGFAMPVSALRSEGWSLERPEVLALMEKLRSTGTPLGEYVKGRFYRGVLTGLNKAFVIDAQTRESLIAEDPSSEEIIKPWLRGRDIVKWKIEWANLYLINIPSSVNQQWPWSQAKNETEAFKLFQEAYPAVHKHLRQWEDKLKKRDDKGKFWWELRSCAYYKEFGQPKIILGRFMNKATFAFDKNSFLHNDALYMIAGASEYIVAILNSTISWWFLSQICTDLQNGYLQAFRENLFQIPIPNAKKEEQATIINRVQTIIESPDSSEASRLESEIDELIYELYGLTLGEIEIVESSIRSI